MTTQSQPAGSLDGKRGLIVGISNSQSIAAGCAQAFRQAGAVLAATYLNDKARPHVQAVADSLGVERLAPCDVRIPGQMDAVFEGVARQGEPWISCSTPSPSRPKLTCTGG